MIDIVFLIIIPNDIHIVSSICKNAVQKCVLDQPVLIRDCFLVSTYVAYVRDFCDAQAGFWLNSKFWSKFSRKPLSGIEDQKAPPPISENFRFGMTKVYSGIPPPHFGKLQIWHDQSLLRNTPPPFRKTSDLG